MNLMTNKVGAALVGGALLLAGTPVAHTVRAWADDPRLLWAAAQYKFAVGDNVTADRLLARLSAKVKHASPTPAQVTSTSYCR